MSPMAVGGSQGKIVETRYESTSGWFQEPKHAIMLYRMIFSGMFRSHAASLRGTLRVVDRIHKGP